MFRQDRKYLCEFTLFIISSELYTGDIHLHLEVGHKGNTFRNQQVTQIKILTQQVTLQSHGISPHQTNPSNSNALIPCPCISGKNQWKASMKTERFMGPQRVSANRLGFLKVKYDSSSLVLLFDLSSTLSVENMEFH
jgi:hypothetical protein